MKKRIALFTAVLLLFCLLTGCAEKPSTETSVPDIVKKTNGGEKWQTKIDYANEDNWLAINDSGKAVDVIYFYPTAFNKADESAPDVADIDDAGMRETALHHFRTQATAFEEDCNIYAPFYRQISAPYSLTLSAQENDDLMRYSASQDPSYALDYYFEHYNNGKPFILAGHSQGSQILTMILSDYMAAHPEYYENMIAAYVIGYSVTGSYLEANPHLKFAEGADDTGVIISYNTEGPANKDMHNAVVTTGAVSINPIYWKRDDTYAAASENAGSLDAAGALVNGFADAQIDLERGVVVCRSADPAVYAIPTDAAELFGPESYHGHDYGFYYINLRENARVRIEAFQK